MENSGKYFVGLDIGTNSVGWAVTDKQYKLLRGGYRKKLMWGSHLFTTASDCKERRLFRCARRRLNRRKYRIDLLNSLFEKEISKVDKTFLQRLHDSSLHIEDKAVKIKYPYFGSKEKEKEFHREYPTIWKLRLQLIKNDPEAFNDIRKVYLAIHHIIKYRGNFLIEGDYKTDSIKKFDTKLAINLNKAFCETVSFDEDGCIPVDLVNPIELEKVFVNKKKINKKDLKKALLDNVLNQDKTFKDIVKELSLALVGSDFNMCKLLNVESDEKKKINLSKFDEERDEWQEVAGDSIAVIDSLYKIYSWRQVYLLLQGKATLSQSFVDIYEQHKEDIHLLLKICRDIDSEIRPAKSLYQLMFKDEYASSNKSNTKKDLLNNFHNMSKHRGGIKPVEVQKFIKKVILDKEEIKAYCQADLNSELSKNIKKLEERLTEEDSTFLFYPAIKSTSSIPHQLHYIELVKILENAVQYPHLKFLESEIIKIEQLFKFRVPYYVGPTPKVKDAKNPQFTWAIRKPGHENEQITPWNFNDVIDIGKTRNEFIGRMVRKCSYLPSENCLPKSSLLYEEYVAWDIINNISIDGKSLDKELKRGVYDIALRQGKVTYKNIQDYLTERNIKESLSGIDSDVSISLKNSKIALSIFPDVFSNTKNGYDHYEIVEDIIYTLTVFGDDLHDALKLIENKYGNELSLEQLKLVSTIKTESYGRLSRVLLTSIHPTNSETGEVDMTRSIIQEMRDTNSHFMKIINSSEYSYAIKIFKDNHSSMEKMKIESMLDSFPSVTRRAIKQSLDIVKEIKHIKGDDPEKIFIEVTREDDSKKKNKKTKSRLELYQILLNELNKDQNKSEKLQSFCKKTNLDIDANKLSEKAKKSDENGSINGERVYLYLKQLGIDLYTGKKIDFEKLISIDGNTFYDVDHVIPQSLTKDDSFDNKVLTEKDINQKMKGDVYPLPSTLRKADNIVIWKFLRSKNLMSDKLFNSLMRVTPLSEEEIGEFENRQLNVVNVVTNAIRDIFRELYPKSIVVFSKARNISDFRHEYNYLKCRELNDLHHAHDAYLNIVVGNVLDEKYTKDLPTIIRNKYEDLKNKLTSKSLDETTNGKSASFKLINCFRAKTLSDHYGNVYWDRSYHELIKCNLLSATPIVTMKTEVNHGAYYNQKMVKKGDGLLPIKRQLSDTTKYGGYSGVGTAQFILCQTIDRKGRVEKRLFAVPIIFNQDINWKEMKNVNLVADSRFQKFIDCSKYLKIELVATIPLFTILRWSNLKLAISGQGDENRFRVWKLDNCIIRNFELIEYLRALIKNKVKISYELGKNGSEIPFDYSYSLQKKDKKGQLVKFTINREQNLLLFKEFFLGKEKSFKCEYFLNESATFEEAINKFSKLSFSNQFEILDFILKRISRTGEGNLEIPALWNVAGLIRQSASLSNCEYIEFTSPTGLFFKRIKL